ncbi:MAG: PriCT-2 domain-containing protein [Treponema sp.]|nr:PriCT-2 domain-containing protein [Treponema sp.]
MRKISSIKFNLGHLEILADGQYFVTEGIHPVTKQKYTWYGGSPQTIHAKDLPPITEEQAYKIIAWFEERARSYGAEPETKITQSNPSGAAVPNVLNVPYAKKPIGLKLYWCINLLNRFDPSCKRKRWIKIGMALHHEFRGSPEAFKIWDEWSARSKTKYVPGETAYQWQSFSREYTRRPITGASLIFYSKKKGKISSRAPKKPKRLPLNEYCQKAITVLQNQSAKSSPWSLRGLLGILQRYLKTGRPTVEKILKNLLQDGLLINNSSKEHISQYTLTEKGKLPCLPERKETNYAG